MKAYFKSQVIRSNGGFTLVEVLVALFVMMAALAIVIPIYNSSIKPTIELNGAARQLFSDIQRARLEAVSKNQRCGLDFGATPDDYVVFVDEDSNHTYETGERVLKRVHFASVLGYTHVSFDESQGGGDGVTFKSGGVENSFTFSSRGLPWPSGSVYLQNSKNPPEGRRVIVSTVGGVRIEEYDP